MVSFRSLFLLGMVAVSVASPIVKRSDVSLLIKDIGNIDTALKKQNTTLASYNGGFFGAITATPLLLDFAVVHISIEKAIFDTNESPALNSTDSLNLVIELANSLLPDIPSSIDLLIAKEPVFAAEGLKKVMEGLLELLVSDNAKLSAALEAKLDSSVLGLAEFGIGIITAAIQKGVDAYAS